MTTTTFTGLRPDQLQTAAVTTAQVRAAYGKRRPTPAGRTRTVPGAHHMLLTMRSGVLDDDARAVFTKGQCHALAIALNLRTGWPIAYIGAPECAYDTACAPYPEHLGWCQCQVDHLGVWTPDGHFLDVNGPVTPADAGRTWVDAIYGGDWADYRDPDDEDADLPHLADTVKIAPATVLTHVTSGGQWRTPEVSLALSITDQVLALT